MSTNSTNNYTLADFGDPFEIEYWDIFIKDKFPSYESFWAQFVVPLTNRPTNSDFKTDEELKRIGKTPSDVCIAQLNYTLLRHLARSHDLITQAKNTKSIRTKIDILMEGFLHIVGAQDNAFEILQRYNNREKYKAFDEHSGKTARDDYKEAHNPLPLTKIRKYRNNLVHGRICPGEIKNEELWLPNIESQTKYFDWRLDLKRRDLSTGDKILESAWQETIDFIDAEWNGMLQPDDQPLINTINGLYDSQKNILPHMDSNIAKQIASYPLSATISQEDLDVKDIYEKP